jgi:hypothetical protein
MIDPESVRMQIAARLPIRVRWLVDETPLDFDFSRSQAPLRSIAAGDIIGGGIEEEWTSLDIFGEDDYAEEFEPPDVGCYNKQDLSNMPLAGSMLQTDVGVERRDATDAEKTDSSSPLEQQPNSGWS